MKFQKLSLMSAAAVLSTMVSAGAYTQPAPAPVIPTTVGNLDGMAFYVGGSLSTLGGFARNQSYTLGTAEAGPNNSGTAGYASDATVPVTPGTLTQYSATAVSSDITSTVNSLKFGGEGHLGAYFGVAEGFGLGIEAFGVTRTSFNPVSSVSFRDVGNSTSAITLSTGTPVVDDNANIVTTGLDISPKSLGYGFRVQPTVMLSDVFGMYASIGYGSQKWEGTLTNNEYFSITNQDSTYTASSEYASGITGIAGQAISKTFSGMNYGLGSVFNIDEVISVYTSVEVQQFSTYSKNAVAAPIAVTTIPTSVTAAIAVPSSATNMFTGGATSIVDAGSTATPSSIKLQLNTYSVGVDYAFA